MPQPADLPVSERARTGAVASVVLVPAPGRLEALRYRVAAELGDVAPGMRVLVPLGSRRCMGVVLGVTDGEAGDDRLRDLIALLDREPVLGDALLRLVRWMAEYYLAPLGDAMATALPGALRVETERVVSATSEGGDGGGLRGLDLELWQCLHALAPPTVASLRRRLGPAVDRSIQRLRRRGLVRVSERLRREVAPTRRVRFYEIAAQAEPDDPCLARRPALRQLYQYLRDHPVRRADLPELSGSFANCAAKLRALAAVGLVRVREEESYRAVLPPVDQCDRRVSLNPAQQAAVARIARAMETGFETLLLWGVTGSGKTEVYLRAVAAALARQRTALLLVPEISLTHQLVDRARARFGDRVAVLHSGLSVGERWDQWRRIARGEAAIAIGARSAVFAPLANLGLIVVDEEHDPAYKQADGVHYQGRDVAVMRAKLEACPLVSGSATPSMESLANVRAGRYVLIELPERVESRPLPEVRLVDMRGPGSAAVLSPQLAAAIEANLAAGGQTLLLLNRRGFANFLQCRACGEPAMCPNCSVTLTWHRQRKALCCHYCDHTMPPPGRCASCGEPALAGWGVGTEQLESLLRSAFPGARVGRMDRDTTRRKGAQAALLRAWTGGALDILIGTQMIAKGHDVPGVTLVGVVMADQSLNFPDFRAAERTVQLLSQVAGRAGRGDRPGRVIVQTLQPDHYSLRAVLRHRFAAFAEAEMATRREVGYPPFVRLVLLRVEGEQLAAVECVAGQAARCLRERAAGRVAILGPAPAPLERLRQRHRRQILVRSQAGAALRRLVAEVVAEVGSAARRQGVRLVADVDPYNML